MQGRGYAGSALATGMCWHWRRVADGHNALLDPAERARCRGFGSAERRRSFVAGRTALKTLVARQSGLPPGAVHVRVLKDGSPAVPGPGHVSLAHSGHWAVAVWAPVAIGIDVEQIQPRDPSVARFLFAPDDRSILQALPGTTSEQLVLAWTLKEAVLKARRSGFRCSPKAIRLQVDTQAQTARAVVTRDTPHDHWHLGYGRREDYWWAWALPDASPDAAM